MAGYANYNFSNEPTEIENKSREIAYKAACEGIVLLENNGVMPVKKGSKIALFGFGAAHTSKGGSGSGDVNERHSVSILEGLENAGYEITSKYWMKKLDDQIAEANKNMLKNVILDFKANPGIAGAMGFIGLIQGNAVPKIDETISKVDIYNSKDADVAIYVATRQAGEGSDRQIARGDNDLSEVDIKNLKLLTASFEKVILVINVGCSLNMSFLKSIPGLGAVVFFAQQGEEGGNAFASILSGKVCPSGKLTDTWAKDYADIPFADEYSYNNGDVKNEYYKEGLMVGYRYFDSFGKEPQYPFGYGLSYTSFDIGTKDVAVDGTKVTVTVEVKNTGAVAGKEVVQIYQSAPEGTLRKEEKALVAFEKTVNIRPKQTKVLKISYDLADTASYDEKKAAWILDAGDYVILVGDSSRDAKPVAIVALDRLVVTEQCTNICPVVKEFDELEIPHKYKKATNLPLVRASADAFTTKTHEYIRPYCYHDEEVDAVMKTLTTKEKAFLCVGQGMGDAARLINCKGSVGHSTTKLLEKGVPNVEFCDGPAGLRIARQTNFFSDGTTKSAGLVTNTDWIPAPLKKLTGKKDEGTPIKKAYQYATAWPVSIAQAQTWNTKLIGEVGKQVGLEMQEFACTYWLAPGVNLHRNPLCGRNFEYYSEDPLLTGKMAASLIAGVQKIPGQYVAMKHYACNNQEDGRMGGDSIVSERALRELYLKGFGIAVKEAKCSGVMSSYNLINGVPASNCYDTLNKVLRNEWGFDGIVMSDWFGSLYSGKPAHGIMAGNDLQMPGIGIEPYMILAGLKLGIIDKFDLDVACRNILRQILHSESYRQYKAGEMVEE